MSCLGKDKFILDATAGYRMMWFNKQDPDALFLDCRKEVNPDVVGDFRDLSSFPDESFYMVVFDPQHRTEKDGYPKGFALTYGALLPETWHSDFRKAFNEFWRILKPHGVLIFKWSTQKIKVKEVLSVFPIKPKFGQRTTGTKGKRNGSKTYWFCFMKIPEKGCET